MIHARTAASFARFRWRKYWLGFLFVRCGSVVTIFCSHRLSCFLSKSGLTRHCDVRLRSVNRNENNNNKKRGCFFSLRINSFLS